MRLIRFIYKKKIGWGILDTDTVRLLEGSPFEKLRPAKTRIPFRRVRLLAPAEPRKIVLCGLNYRDHAKELNIPLPREPIIFLKPPTALIGHRQNIVYPPAVKRLDYEAELAIVIKKQARNIPEEKAGGYIFGYTCLNDVTARDLQKKDVQWARAKSFDTFCPLGPWVETSLDPSCLKIRSYLNGKLMQDSYTSRMIFSVHYLVAFISRIMTLLPGDLISTGTPPGVGRMLVSDKIEIEIEGIGRLVNNVAAAKR
jgi:2-keto-4-pentenoate hydratase/2-oxohepta-3-ene-1,7-dioic acid hydratase in catechol pathway